MTYENILYDVADHVATITINRPESMNAISYKARDELARRLRSGVRRP